MARDDEIRMIAYSIWDQEGRRDGHDREHWQKAEMIWESSQRTRAVAESATPNKTGKAESGRKIKAIGRNL